ncbi:TPA: hypothetical protein N0F65_000568 [Lagenidium giganteum]|uniref:PRORP domain-containing protein n=1 Tax=Lagenidium giganteum TaxID=4803 RepID=A0AAV2Z0C3_9STRA|nr:TPA: hypothetical protein N0F65_000568 [Lagenidium giganteum]
MSTAVDKRTTEPRLNVYHEVVVKQRPLVDVFALVKAEKENKGLQSGAVRGAVDMFFFHCVQQLEMLPAEFLDHVLAFFHAQLFTDAIEAAKLKGKQFVLGDTLNEATVAAAIKIYLARSDVAAAWQLIDVILTDVQGKLHFRTFSSLLLHECGGNDNFPLAYGKWQELKNQKEMEWTPTMEDVLVQMVVACVKQHHRDGKTSTDDSTFHERMTTLLRDIRLASKEISEENANLLRTCFQDAGYCTRLVGSDLEMLPVCTACGGHLVKEPITPEETTKLLRAIESRAIKIKSGITAKEFLLPFRQWLLGKNGATSKQSRDSEQLHYILDGPNIAYINQNFDAGSFRFDHLDVVAEQLMAQGHRVSITMPFGYLAEKSMLRIRTRVAKEQMKNGQFIMRKRSKEEKALIDKWTKAGMIYSCRTDYLSDDYFWIYASILLGKNARVVTNDQGRDHVYALLNHHTTGQKAKKKNAQDSPTTVVEEPISMDLIERWKDQVIVNIQIRHQDQAMANAKTHAIETNGSRQYLPHIPIEEVHLIHPLPFSRVPQLTPQGEFHFPIADTENGATRWLCVTSKHQTKQ